MHRIHVVGWFAEDVLNGASAPFGLFSSTTLERFIYPTANLHTTVDGQGVSAANMQEVPSCGPLLQRSQKKQVEQSRT